MGGELIPCIVYGFECSKNLHLEKRNINNIFYGADGSPGTTICYGPRLKTTLIMNALTEIAEYENTNKSHIKMVDTIAAECKTKASWLICLIGDMYVNFDYSSEEEDEEE